MRFLEEHFVPFAAKLGNQRHLVAIRDAFVVIMPITIAGSLAVLVNSIHGIFAENGLNVPAIQEGYQNFISSTGIQNVMNAISKGSINIMAILLVIALGINMAKSYDADQAATATLSVAVYLAITPGLQSIAEKVSWDKGAEVVEVATSSIASGAVPANKLDANGMFVAMLLTMVVSEIFIRLSKFEKLKITLPDGVPPAVAGSFTVLIPAVLTMIIVVAFGIYTDLVFKKDLWQIITKFVSAPLSNVADTLFTAILIEFLIAFFWTFGLHGASIVGSVTTPILTPLANANTLAFEQGKEIPNIISGVGVYARIGGGGSTIGLIIAVLLFGKVQAERTVVGIATAPGIFQINEPITFGIPIVMNPTYMIPFVAGPTVLAGVSYLCMQFNIIERVCISVPWVTPPVLMAFLATAGGFKGAIFQVISIVFLAILWTPFVMLSNKQNA